MINVDSKRELLFTYIKNEFLKTHEDMQKRIDIISSYINYGEAITKEKYVIEESGYDFIALMSTHMFYIHKLNNIIHEAIINMDEIEEIQICNKFDIHYIESLYKGGIDTQ